MSEEFNFINSYFSVPQSGAAKDCAPGTNEVMTEFPADAVVAMAYIPFQFMGETYEPEKALMNGTLFPELNKPFYGKCV